MSLVLGTWVPEFGTNPGAAYLAAFARCGTRAKRPLFYTLPPTPYPLSFYTPPATRSRFTNTPTVTPIQNNNANTPLTRDATDIAAAE
jgi:hypothetical protein